MTTAFLNMSPGDNGTCWDKLVLAIKSDSTVTPMIRMNRHEALEAYRQIAIAEFEGEKGSLVVTIGTAVYNMAYDVWQAVGDALDQWYEQYMTIVEKVY